MKQSRTLNVCMLAAFAILLGTRLFYISQKKSFMVDEGLSISICNINEYGFWANNYDLGKEYNGKELKEISLWDNPTVRDSLRDVFLMHRNNRDSPHTNFYYSLLRLWFTGVRTSDLKYIFWRGCILNVLFFVISFLVMALMIRLFTDSPTILFFSLLVALMNPASLSLTVFLRPYELQQLFIIILTYYVACILRAHSSGLTIETRKNFFIGVAVLSFTMLSAYLSMILIGFYGLFIAIMCIRKKDWALLKFFVVMFAMALMAAKILYLDFGNMGNRGEEAASNLVVSNIVANLISVKNGFARIVSKNIFFGFFCALLLPAATWIFVNAARKDKSGSMALPVVVAVNLVGLFVIMYFVPIDMKTLRYVAPLFPVFALAFMFQSHKKTTDIAVPAFAALLLVLSLIQFNGKKSVVEHLDDSKIENYREIYEAEVPIFVRGESTWRYSCLVPYFNDRNRVIFVSDFSELEKQYSDKIPCIFINQTDESENYDFDAKDVAVRKLTSIPYHDVYFVEN